jgi:hypothetical protein
LKRSYKAALTLLRRRHLLSVVSLVPLLVGLLGPPLVLVLGVLRLVS